MAPSTALLYLGSILTGLGTMLLGPILPLLTRQWHLNDAQGGLLLLAQFCGAFVGGITTSSRLQRDLLSGFAAAGLGLAGFAFAPSLGWACAALAIGGAGIGRTITATNVIAGRRFTANRGSALMLLNFAWSFGAMLSPLLTAWLGPRYPLQVLLESFAALFALCACALLLQTRGLAPEATVKETQPETHRATTQVLVYFCILMVLYGGLETCLNGWMTTFALRYGHGGASALARGEYTMVLLLLGRTVGRAVSSWLLLRIRETPLQRISLSLSVLFAAALATAHNSAAIAGFAVVLGLSLAPVFPSVFSLFMAHRPTARQAGVMIAASAIGAAALPWLMGVLSTATGSLQIALALPCAAALAMLLLSFKRQGSGVRV